MQASELILTVMGSILSAGVIGFFAWFFKAWKKTEKRRDLYFMKIDCMIQALSNMDCEIGEQFRQAYNTLFDKRMDEEQYIKSE